MLSTKLEAGTMSIEKFRLLTAISVTLQSRTASNMPLIYRHITIVCIKLSNSAELSLWIISGRKLEIVCSKCSAQ